MDPVQFRNDIPLDLATRAHAGTSHVPETRGAHEVEAYARMLAADYARMQAAAEMGGTSHLLEAEFARYREGLKRHVCAWLIARARCLSPMITGPARFPTARNDKRNSAARKRGDDLQAFRERALAAIVTTLRPDLRPIMAGDADAVERLQAKIRDAEDNHSRMKAVNAAIVRNRGDRAAQYNAIVAAGLSPEQAREALTPDPFGGVGFPSYTLSNNRNNIARMRQRLARIEQAKAAPCQEIAAANGIRLEDSPAENRIRLYFPGKPSAEIRASLKACGFRWARTLGAWQGYRNDRTLAKARELAAG